MLLPAKVRRVAGLKRSGLWTWRATDEDPQFRFRFGRLRPRHLILIADGIDCRLEPVVYLDTGQGFDEDESLTFGRSGRFVIHIPLLRLPELRGLRFDPLGRPGDLRFRALSISSSLAARWLFKRLARSSVPIGPTRILTLESTDIRSTDTGLKARRYRRTADHFADVIALQRDVQPDLPQSADPTISFLVPTFNTKTDYLDDLMRSFRAQAPLAEIIFSDDGSRSAETLAWLDRTARQPGVQVVRNATNRGIAATTNAALAKAHAPWIALIDHDDALADGAVAQVADALSAHPNTSFLYTDEAIADANLRVRDYFLKPAYDPVFLSGVNYINHLSVFRRDRLRAIGGFRDGFNGSQDYDLLLRYLAGIPEDEVMHLPYPAYIWRRHADSFSTAHEDGAVATARKALRESYARPDRPVRVSAALAKSLHRVEFDPPQDGWPLVSIVIPNRDAAAMMRTVLAGLDRTDYPNLEIVVVDNDSTDPEVLTLYEDRRAGPVRFTVVQAAGAFNFSRSVNAGIALARGSYVLLLNNDIEVLSPDWLKEMVSCFAYPGTGIVGARLLYPDDTLQHAGVIVGLGGLAGHWFCGSVATTRGPMGRLTVRQSLSAVTGAAMLISRTCLDAVGAFDEERFAIAYNDIDFCLRAREVGFRVVWTPFATLTHHESKSRGSDQDPARIERFRREQQNLRDRHASVDYCDPAFNPWYTRDRAVPGLQALDELPAARTCAPTNVAARVSRPGRAEAVPVE